MSGSNYDQQFVPSTSASTLQSTPASSRASTPSQSEVNKTNFTSKQREWIGHALFYVIKSNNIPLDGNLHPTVYEQVSKILQELPNNLKFNRLPARRSMLALLKSMVDPIQLINKPSKAGRQKLDINSNIQAELATEPESTSKDLSERVPASQSTISRRLKSIKELGLHFYRNKKV